MKPVSTKAAGWLFFLFLFAGCAFSMVSMFWGDLWFLLFGVICLVIGIYFLKQYMSAPHAPGSFPKDHDPS